MSDEQVEQKQEDPRPHFAYMANAKLSLKKFVSNIGSYGLDEVTSPVAESEARKEGENLRVVEISLLQSAIIHWQTVDSLNAVSNHTSLIYLDFVNDKAYFPDGNEVSDDLGAEVKKLLANAKGQYLVPNVPIEKLEQNMARSKQIFDHERV